MKNLLLAVILLFDVSDLRAVTRNSTITIGMSFPEAQILLQNYDAVEVTIGISRPIGDIFPHYKLHDGRIFSIYCKQSSPNTWAVSFIDEVMPTLLSGRCDYSYIRVNSLSLSEPDLNANIRVYLASLGTLSNLNTAEQGAAANP